MNKNKEIQIRQDKSSLTTWPEPLKDVWKVIFRNKDGVFEEEFGTLEAAVVFAKRLGAK